MTKRSQRFFIRNTKTGAIIGTNSFAGFTELSAQRHMAAVAEQNPKHPYEIVEVKTTIEENWNG